MTTETPHRSILELTEACLHEITDHLLQDQVNSSHMRNIRNLVLEIAQRAKEASLAADRTPKAAERTRVGLDRREDILKLAYALSRFDYHLFNEMLGLRTNQSGVFCWLSKRTGVKESTLRNMRDAFDPYVKQEASNRKGWHQAELSDDGKAVKAQLDKLTRIDITQIVRRIIKG